MLTPLPTSSTTAASTARQINIKAPSGGGVMYTVPAGKTFTGYIPVTMGNGCEVLINGVEIMSLGPTTPYFAMAMPVTLVAGTVVSSGASYRNWSMYGVEQ